MPIFRCILAITVIPFLASLATAQVPLLNPNNPGRRADKLLDLQLGQQRNDSNIGENRVTRQAEIARIEGRLLDLENRLDRFATAPKMNSLVLFEFLGKMGEQSGNQNQPSSSLRKLVLDDYVMGLQIELTRAQIDRLKASDQLQAIQQMQARGLASKPQLELKELENQEAALRVTRLERLLSGTKKLTENADDEASATNADQ